MTGLRAAIATEWLKSRRSQVPWLVLVGFSIVPMISGLFMVILKDPEGARKLGLLGAKAQLAGGTADWPTLLGMLAQAMAVGGAILFAFLTSWVYGREFTDRTMRGLLAIPTGRAAIVLAKAIVIGVWGLLISAWVIALGFGVGFVVGLPGWSDELARSAAVRIAAAAILTIVLQPMTGLLASVGRGFIAGLAWTVVTVAAAQVLLVLDVGGIFPWAIPALIAGAAGPAAAEPSAGSLVLVVLTGLVGIVMTITWWRRADHTG